MITTAQLATELKISQRAIQNQILRLGLKVQRAGRSFVLSPEQAKKVREYRRTSRKSTETERGVNR